MNAEAQNGTAVIIVAAGRGERAGGNVAKQWRDLAGARVIDHTLHAFRTHEAVDRIIVVLNRNDMSETFEDAQTVAGGATREQSVKAGLDALKAAPPSNVLIHDAARPCVTHSVIDNVLSALDHGLAAAPAVPVTDALWTGADGHVTGTQDRNGLYRAQTPQGFSYAAILTAHDTKQVDAADDVEVARNAGLDVRIVEGSEDNIKITHPPDFDRAARILETLYGHQARQRI